MVEYQAECSRRTGILTTILYRLLSTQLYPATSAFARSPIPRASAVFATMTFLQPIPENQSDHDGLAGIERASTVESSVLALRAGRSAGSRSDAPALLGAVRGGAEEKDHLVAIVHQRKLRRRRAWMRPCSLAFVALVVAIVVGVCVVQLTPSPQSTARTMLTRLIHNVTRSISGDEVHRDPRSPQSIARKWLIQEDLLREEWLRDSNITEQLIQRYVLSVLFIGADAKDLMQVDADECDWEGVECDEDQLVRYVLLDGFELKGTLPIELQHLSVLQELSLSKNSFQGTIPDWQDMSNLYYLDLSSNDLSGEIPGSIWQHPLLRFLYLHENELSGNLTNFQNATFSPFLQDVWLDDNQLTGIIPNWIAKMSSLSNWFCVNNLLEGTLPRRVSASLQFLDASNNSLTGTIPQTLLDAPSLEQIFLNDNFLNGTLPEQLNEESPLQIVWLQNNELDGSVPETFGQNWFALQQLLLQGNKNLTGSFNLTQCSNWFGLSRLEVDCEGFPVCECCTACF